ncbi:FkbM family methyltransferase [Brachyspira catarrhinii]|uniref:FkbM family methyltransferase n=1 Tax=Brachyspira catarrhinii TaxID=2528966 RepID=A0ABY2TTC0_9SPIR|nr:FkbM family methyltransferase [Brachyspira catarrhinii]TKZ35848.1 FkbM family methyltransferase [Brachyspira catarrhinii]
MTSKTIDNIVWFIPFKKLRDSVRDYLLFQYNIRNDIYGFLQSNNNLKDIVKEQHLSLSSLKEDIKEFISLNKPKQAVDIGLISRFREHIKNDNNFLSKYTNLITNLDDDSIKIINNIIAKICNYNNIEDEIYFTHDELKELNKFEAEYYNKIIKINEELFIYYKYVLPFNQFEIEVFYDKCGIDYIKNINNIKNKSIIDAGGFIGDSAIVFSNYTDKNVYSFEPFLRNYNMILKTIELNKKNNIIPVNIALGDENKDISIYSRGNIDSGLSVENKKEINSVENKVKMVTLDSYVKENNIEVGLIKTDLEGFEQPFLKGAINTIKEQKPVLIISIYHNYSDFFEIKPMIENLNLGYKFRIIKNKCPKIIGETKLLAEVC